MMFLQAPLNSCQWMVTEKAREMLRRSLVGISALSYLVICGGLSVAQDNWGAKMFDRQTVEFGTVAKGADTKLRIKVRNVYQEAIQITSANTSCACFKATVVDGVNQIPSGQSAEIEISVNTLNYQRKRDATLTVNLYEPSKGASAEVKLPLHAYIRTDVVFSPGAVNFGSIDHGIGTKQLVKVAYAGRNDWQIRDVQSSNTHVITEIKETSRGNGLVNYDLYVELKPDAPLGALRDQLTLITNDGNSPQVPLTVYGSIEADITLVTNMLDFSELTPGESRTKPLVIRAKKPITIEKIEREKSDESFRVKLPEDARLVHSLPITLVAPNEPGAFEELFTVTIAGRVEPLTFRARGKISAPVSSSSAN